MNDSQTLTQVDIEIAKRCILRDGAYWMSQIRMADLFSLRISTICELLSSLNPTEIEAERRVFTLLIPQGKQKVRKKILHYSMSVVYNVAIRKRAVDLLPRIQTFLPPGTVVPISPRIEYRFGLDLDRILNGITPIERQASFPPYKVDFYLPELHIAIEHDGDYHNDPAVQMADLDREVELENEYGLKVIRVPFRDESSGINEILKAVLASEARRNA